MAGKHFNACYPLDEPIQLNSPQIGQCREWLDLKALTRYASVSERTMRQWIHRSANPLPAVRVGTKILIRRSEFDCWLENHRIELVNVGAIIDKLVSDLAAER